MSKRRDSATGVTHRAKAMQGPRDRAGGLAPRGAAGASRSPRASCRAPRRAARRGSAAAPAIGRMAASSSASRHAAIARPRSAAASAAIGVRVARGGGRALLPRGVEVARVELAPREDDGAAEKADLLAFDAEDLDAPPPVASRTTTRVDASRAGASLAIRVEIEHRLRPNPTPIAIAPALLGRAKLGALLVRGRLDEPPRVVIRRGPDALERQRDRRLRLDRAARAPRELDHRAPDAQPLERARDVERPPARKRLRRTRSRSPSPTTSTFSNGTCGLPGHEQRFARARPRKKPDLSERAESGRQAASRGDPRSRASGARRSRSSTRTAPRWRSSSCAEIGRQKAKLHRVRLAGLRPRARPGARACRRSG